jgi:hypothetical protein
MASTVIEDQVIVAAWKFTAGEYVNHETYFKFELNIYNNILP